MVVSMNNRSLTYVLKTASLGLVILGFAGIFFFSSAFTREGKFWSSWYPLLIPSVQMSEDLEQEIFSIAPSEPVSMSNSMISYGSYDGTESVSIRDFTGGMGPNRFDPRIDPWMTGISAYFQQDIYEILYLPNSRTPLEYRRVFEDSQLMSRVNWILPDEERSPEAAVLYAAVILLLCAGCLRFVFPGGAFLFAGYFIFRAGLNGLFPFLAVTALLLRLAVKKGRWYPLRMILPFLPAGFLLLSGQIPLRYVLIVLLVFSVFAGAVLYPGTPGKVRRATAAEKKPAVVKKTKLSWKKQDHAFFEPVSLTAHRRPAAVQSRKEFPTGYFLIAAALAAFVLTGLQLPSEKSLPAGIPAALSAGGEWNYDNLSRKNRISGLPDGADYLKHRAYQDSFLYGGSYSLPMPGSSVSFENYSLQDGRIMESRHTALVFSDEWYSAALGDLTLSGPGKLMAGETGPAETGILSREITGTDLHQLMVYAVFICVFVLIHLSGLHHAAQKSSIRSYGKFVLRRKQQAA